MKTKGSIKIVSDIHGCLLTFKKMIETFPDDFFYIAGDIVDRGPSSAQLVAFIRENPDRFFMTKGNHEEMLDNPAMKMIHVMYNGGGATYQSYRDFYDVTLVEEKMLDDFQWLKTRPRYLLTKHFDSNGRQLLVSHTCICYKNYSIERLLDIYSEGDKEALWRRGTNIIDIPNIFNVWGHTPQKDNIYLSEHGANIDTGCCYPSPYGKLSCIDFFTKEVTSFDCIDFLD